VTDVPPIPHEEWMPPTESILYKVALYYMSAESERDFWVNEGKRWSMEVDQFAESSKTIDEAVQEIVAPGDSDLAKAKKLYKAVQALDNTGFSRTKTQVELKKLGLHTAKHAQDTWAQKSGTSEDIALLYLAMLRAAGLTAYDMKVVDRSRRDFAPNYLSFSQLSEDVVILSTGGKDILLDPGEKMCPFETLHWKHSAAGGIRQGAGGPLIAATPTLPYAANILLRAGDVTLDDHGGFTASLHVVMNGQDALQWRQTALENDLSEVKKRFDEWLKSTIPDGVDAHVDHFLGLDDPDQNLLAAVHAQGTLGNVTSRRILLPGYFFEARGSHPFVDEDKRLEPVDMHYANQVMEQIVYHFPAGSSVEGAPQDAKISWEGHAVLVDKSKKEPGQITLIRQLTRAFTFAKADEYQSLTDFYRKVAAADQEQLVLSRDAAAKGN
jgi:hypothetical protein